MKLLQDSLSFLKLNKLAPSFCHAVRFLTLFPLGNDDESEIDPSLFLFSFPVVGLLIGLVLLFVLNLAVFFFPISLASLVTVIAYVLLTRKLHLDGVSDFMDGFFGGKDKEDTLRIMKDPHAGSFGVIGLILVLYAFWGGVESLYEIKRFHLETMWVLVAAPCVARWVLLYIATGAKPAQENGLGKWFLGLQSQKTLWISAVLPVLLMIGVFRFWGILFFGLILLYGSLIRSWSNKKIGGITGDVLGFGLETSQILVFVLGALFF